MIARVLAMGLCNTWRRWTWPSAVNSRPTKVSCLLCSVSDGTRAMAPHALSTIALYTPSQVNSRRSVVDCKPHSPRLPRCHQVLSTPGCPLSLFILHSPVGVPYRTNFQVQRLGQSSRGKYTLFLEISQFL